MPPAPFLEKSYSETTRNREADLQRFSRSLKRLSKKWLRLSNQVAQRAARYGRMQGADYVFCGHTHRAAALEIEGVGYFNTGCCTDMPSHFITIDSENRIELHAQE